MYARTRFTLVLVTALVAARAEAKLAELLITDSGVRKGIELDTANVEATIDQTSARVSYDLTFMSRLGRNLEGTFYFALPRGSYVHEFGMWIDGKYQGSAITEAKAGRVAYESIVRRGVDPALLEWTAGNNFKMRVFPVIPGKPTRIKLVVGMPADLKDGALKLAFPLDLGKVASFDLKVRGQAHTKKEPVASGMKGLKLVELDFTDGVMEFEGKFDAKNFLPPDEISVTVRETDQDELKVRRGDGDKERFFEAHVFPELDAKTRPAPARAAIVWDFSLSEAEHHEARLEALKTYLAARKPGAVDVYGFNQRVFSIKEGVKGEFGAVSALLKAQPYDGGTRLDLLADFLRGHSAKHKASVTDLVLFTNGVDSFELFDFKRVKAFGHDKLHAFVVAPTVGAGGALLSSFARALSAVVIDQGSELGLTTFTSLPWTLAKAHGSKTLSGLELPASPSVFPGDGVAVRGKIKKDGKAELTLVFKRDGKDVKKSYDFDTNDVKLEDHTSVPRMWAAAHIDRLLPEKRQHADDIKRTALDHQLMSPYTVMVVLEFCEDYEEFKLEAPKDCPKRADRWRDQIAEGGDDGDMMEDAADDEVEGDMESADLGASPDAAGAPSGDMFAEESAGDAPPPLASDAPAPAAAAAPKMMPSDGMSVDAAIADFEGEEPGGPTMRPEPDTTPRPYGFEAGLAAKAKQGVPALYAEYLRARAPYEKIPFYYIFAAELFARAKRPDLAELVLSNVVEVRPGDARWLRIYAYSLISWGKARDTVPIYRAIAELRDEDPQSHRDFGLAMEAIGQPVAAMRLFEKVFTGKWDSRLAGMNKVIQHDLARASAAALKTAGLSAENRAMAVKYAGVDQSKNDKIVATVSWDTDNTDIDLHVIEPSGAHVYYGDLAPQGASGRLSFDTTQGFGPEQYRAAKPHRGKYRMYLRYFSQNMQALQDGTFARIDVKITEKGQTSSFTKTLFLKDQEEVRTFVEFDYQDPSSVPPPPSYAASMAQVKALLAQKKATEALKILNALGKQAAGKQEALRHFHMARAHLILKAYDQAEMANQRALTFDPNLVAAHYNNACAASLAKNKTKAVHHLGLLADALQSRSEQRSYFVNLMKTDGDLAFVRSTKEFKSVQGRIKLAH